MQVNCPPYNCPYYHTRFSDVFQGSNPEIADWKERFTFGVQRQAEAKLKVLFDFFQKIAGGEGSSAPSHLSQKAKSSYDKKARERRGKPTPGVFHTA